ncbi:FadR/GntR family transcriptional regulator [Streptomyces adustus]|uniref:FadR/GntR family transcriptional regulator n=1 Tax=Streptomyces adustus TaxID=1609272 RepID=UPI0035DAE7D8
MAVDSLPRRSVVDLLEARLREAILGGTHKPGSLLPPERELAAGYGVTRTTLKHALTRLEKSGLLSTRHGIGTRILDYLQLGGADLLPMLAAQDHGWLREIFEARRHIGTLIAGRAATRRTARQARRLEELLRLVADAPDPDSIQLADVEVHRELARATGNRVYVLLTNTLLNAYLPLRTTLQAPFEDATQAWKRLAPVVHAVVDRQGEDAQRAAEAYLRGTEKIMLNSLEHGRRSSAVDNSG